MSAFRIKQSVKREWHCFLAPQWQEPPCGLFSGWCSIRLMSAFNNGGMEALHLFLCVSFCGWGGEQPRVFWHSSDISWILSLKGSLHPNLYGHADSSVFHQQRFGTSVSGFCAVTPPIKWGWNWIKRTIFSKLWAAQAKSHSPQSGWRQKFQNWISNWNWMAGYHKIKVSMYFTLFHVRPDL